MDDALALFWGSSFNTDSPAWPGMQMIPGVCLGFDCRFLKITQKFYDDWQKMDDLEQATKMLVELKPLKIMNFSRFFPKNT